MHRTTSVMLGLAIAAVLACGGGGGGGGGGSTGTTPAPVNGGGGGVSKSLQVSPLGPDALSFIVPLGALNPPGHTLPTDHIYFYVTDSSTTHPVYAPAAGVVSWLYSFSPDDGSVTVDVTADFSYRLGHVKLDAAIVQGASVTSGQQVGTTSPVSPLAIDLWATDETVTVSGLANLARYPEQTIHAVAPLALFEEPVRSELYAKVSAVRPDKDGQFDLDVAGRLAGNWFLEGLPTGQPSYDGSAWDKHLSFVYDVYDPTQVRVAIGGTLGVIGAFAVQPGAPDPATVSPATGKVAYGLGNPGGYILPGGGHDTPPFSQVSLLIVEMLADDRIRVEVFNPSTDANADFTAGARVYTR